MRLLGEIMELELEVMLLGEVDTEPDLMLLDEACLSWVARVPRGSWLLTGEAEAGEEEVLGRPADEGFGATGGGTVALFMGGEYRAFRRPRIDFCGESSWC